MAYIYLVHTTGKMYKVGYTNNIQRRQREYNTHNPNAHIVECIELANETQGRLCESIAHDEIEVLYNSREWFKPNTRTFHLNDLICLANSIVIKVR